MVPLAGSVARSVGFYFPMKQHYEFLMRVVTVEEAVARIAMVVGVLSELGSVPGELVIKGSSSG